jgi:hypothetical protein
MGTEVMLNLRQRAIRVEAGSREGRFQHCFSFDEQSCCRGEHRVSRLSAKNKANYDFYDRSLSNIHDALDHFAVSNKLIMCRTFWTKAGLWTATGSPIEKLFSEFHCGQSPFCLT